MNRSNVGFAMGIVASVIIVVIAAVFRQPAISWLQSYGMSYGTAFKVVFVAPLWIAIGIPLGVVIRTKWW